MKAEKAAYRRLVEALGELRVRRGEVLAPHTTFKVGGPADLFFVAYNIKDLIRAVRAAAELKVATFILGGGSNVIVSDEGFRGLVIQNRCGGIRVVGYGGRAAAGDEQAGVVVEAEGGAHLQKLKRWTIEQGLAGLEFVDGVPGTVGGAVKVNVHDRHRRGKERYLSDVLIGADLLSPAGEVKTVGKDYFEFERRRGGWKTGSRLLETGEIVLRARFALRRGEPEKLWDYVRAYSRWRRDRQPKGLPSSGSFFTNPGPDVSAGRLIDQAGLKGRRVGGAAVSEVHANFIVNDGSAKAADVVALARLIKDEVKKKFGVNLQEEVIYVGEFGSESPGGGGG
jgi:UDP-N-acetylmuramate dehydrogenase